jgi:hypothetical protein
MFAFYPTVALCAKAEVESDKREEAHGAAATAPLTRSRAHAAEPAPTEPEDRATHTLASVYATLTTAYPSTVGLFAAAHAPRLRGDVNTKLMCAAKGLVGAILSRRVASATKLPPSFTLQACPHGRLKTVCAECTSTRRSATPRSAARSNAVVSAVGEATRAAVAEGLGASGESHANGVTRPPATDRPSQPLAPVPPPAKAKAAGAKAVALARPDFSQYHVRLATFARWPRKDFPPEPLALAGFYYIAQDGSDLCGCFCCRGTLYDWDPSDDPWCATPET